MRVHNPQQAHAAFRDAWAATHGIFDAREINE